MTDRILKICSVFAGLFIILGLVLGCIDLLCFDRAFYTEEYSSLNTAASIGMSPRALDETTDVLLSYLRDKRSDLNLEEDINGEVQQVFGEREKAHMVDVKALYLGGMRLGYTLLGVGAVFAVVMLVFLKKRRIFLKGYIIANGIFLAVFAVLAIYAAADFNTFWTNFHHVFFTNNLWLLDPATDVLIMMVPSQFFFDLVIRIAIMSISIMVVLFTGAFIWLGVIRRKESHVLQIG